MIAAPWIVSLAISSPIALGLNRTTRRADTPRLCTFYNSDFLIYSSMGSFYVPTIVMIVLYWRVYLAIRSRRSVSSSSTRSQQTWPPNESITCMATAPPPPVTEARRGSGPASNSDATLSAVDATLSAVQRRGEELTRVATAIAVDRTATVEQWHGTSGTSSDNQCRPPVQPSIAVLETDDVATLSPPSTSDGSVGTVLPATAQLTPMSLSVVAVDACGVDSTALDSNRCTNKASTMMSCASDLNVSSLPTQKLTEAERDTSDSTTRRPATLSVPPVALEVSALGLPGALAETGGCGAELNTRFNSNEDDGQTVARVETASAAATVADKVNGRFVTFFNFASKQRSAASNAADRRLKRTVRRERRATKTLAIVLGNMSMTF